MNMKAIIVSALALSGACAFGGGVEGFKVATVGDCRSADKQMSGTNVVAQKLCKCDFLLNKDFKKNAKVYLCLFSASWCGPCRAEMPRIAKTYVETLKDDPDIEIIQFSQDRSDDKARAWAREYGVEFPVVRPKGGNPLDLHCSGIPHLFIVKADGTVMEDGHPMRLFAEEKFREIKKRITAGDAEPQTCNRDTISEKAETNTATVDPSFAQTGPYGIRMQPNPGCEGGADYVLKRLREVYLPAAVRYYGDPFGGKSPSRIFTIVVKRNDGSDNRKYTGPSWGSCSDGFNQFTVGLAKDSDKWEMDITLLASRVLTICGEDDGAALHLYVNHLIKGEVKGIDPLPGIKEDIRQGLACAGDNSEKNGRLGVLCKLAPMWAVFEELREKHPTFILDYYNLKNSRYAEGKLTARLSQSQMVGLLGEVTGENVFEICIKHGVKGFASRPKGKVSVAKVLQNCDFLLNKDFKKNAKVYLCLFSASWCPPCRAEMPRIAKTYAKMLKDDPDIELIHFSRDQNDEKALAWAKEHNVKFPVVKPKGGNPLDLHSRGIPHLFIVKADGAIVTEGHPMKLFTEQELHELKIIVDKTNENATTDFKRNNVTCTSLAPQDKISVVEKLDQCDFLINNDFKKDAKYYLCLFSALWCPPRRREMSRIAKTYAGMLKDDPGIELIYFSYDHDDEMVLAWARAHDVKFPIVRDGNPLRLYWRTSGDYLFIVKADGTLLKEGPPKRLFTEEKLRRLMKGEPLSNVATINDIKWTYEIVDGAVALGEGTSRNGLAVSKNTAGAIRIPDTIDGLPVRSIDEYAFSGCSGLTSITIPVSVTKIANYVFEGCRGLSSITIPSGVKEIGSEAFSGCKELMSISVSAENGQYTSREGVLFDKGMRTLVRCPCGIRGTYTLPRGVMHIGRSAFSGCGGLSGVKVPNSVKSVGDYAFDRCQGLTKVTLGSGVKSIGSCAFRDCDGLVSIRIPKSVENIDHSAFIFCSGLKEFIVEPNNRKFTAVNGMLLLKDRSELLAGVDGDVIVPDGVKSIGLQAFCQYSELTSARLPNSVTDIGDSSFYSCVALTSMTIPAKVKSIGRNAFGECRSLTSVAMCGERPESPDDVFRSCGNLKSIHVSANAKSWKGMKEWQGIPLVFDLE